MVTEIAKRIKMSRNINLVTRSRLLLNFLLLMPICAIIGLVAGGIPGMVLAVPGLCPGGDGRALFRGYRFHVFKSALWNGKKRSQSARTICQHPEPGQML